MMPVVEHPDLHAMRRDYDTGPFLESDLAPSWLEQFELWFADAVSHLAEPNAMIVATADEHARPSARTLLLKAVDERGFVFFTNLHSRKGRELAANPRAALVFPWLDLRRQVVVEGAVAAIPGEESDAYFATRPRGAQLGALASPQSEAIESREELERRLAGAEAERSEGEPVPRPEYWGGLRLAPDAVEFWQGRADRLHDRLRYRPDEDGIWMIERLAP
jgi:pyridoxamine 5'-phosphate oxidase